MSIGCSGVGHWVHLRCAGARQARCTDAWACHLRRGSRLTPRADMAPPRRSRPLSGPTARSPPAPPTPPQPGPMSNTPPVPRGLLEPKPNSLVHSPPSPPTPPRARHIHMSHTPPAPLTSTSHVLDGTPEPRVPLIHALTAAALHPDPAPALLSPSHPRTLTAHTHVTQTAVHASQSPQQPHAQHGVLRRPHRQTRNYHRAADATQTHSPSGKGEINLIVLQVNMDGLRNKLEELRLLIHDTHADIITIREAGLTPRAKTPKIHDFTSVRTDGLHGVGGGLIALIGDNITFTTTDMPSTINTHNIELRMVKVHIDNTKHITIANIYVLPRDTTSTHCRTADTEIRHCMQCITGIPHSVLAGDVGAHSTLWHSYTDDHRGQPMADVIRNSDHITLNTGTPDEVTGTTLQQTSSPDITTVSDTLCGRTSWTTRHALSSDHLPIVTTVDMRHGWRLQQSRRTVANYRRADWTQFAEDTESAFAQTTMPTGIHTANRVFANIILMADRQNIPEGKMHSGCRLLPGGIVCRVTRGNNIRRANPCDPALRLLGEEITSDIRKHRQNIWKEHLDAYWDHGHNIHTLWRTIHGLSGRAPPHTLNTSIAFNSGIATAPTHIANCFARQFANTVGRTGQADTLTERHTTCRDTALHSLLLRSKRL